MKTQDQESLAGKKVIVLGGSAGIGLATAKLAAAKGAQICVVSSKQERIDRALAELPEGSAGHVVDLSDEDQIKQFFGGFGEFDHLVYTAGENIKLSQLSETSLADARNYFNIRFWGALTTLKYASPYINHDGSIVLTSGIASARPNAGWALGASICAAMEGFTRAMAIELAPIRVNIVSPGVVKTDLWAGFAESEREQMYSQIGDSLPVKHVAEASEIARAYVYLMEQTFTTGQTLITDGGTVLV